MLPAVAAGSFRPRFRHPDDYADGNYQHDTMVREREQGYVDVAEVHSVYLETDGSLSVVTESAA